MSGGDVIFELTRQGAYLRCAAIHAATGVEVVAVGPATQPEALKRVAVAKLMKALAAR